MIFSPNIKYQAVHNEGRILDFVIRRQHSAWGRPNYLKNLSSTASCDQSKKAKGVRRKAAGGSRLGPFFSLTPLFRLAYFTARKSAGGLFN